MNFTVLFKQVSLALLCSRSLAFCALERGKDAVLSDRPAMLHGVPVWDVTEAEMEQMKGAAILQLPALKFEGFHSAVKEIMKGNGVQFQRDPQVQKNWYRVGMGRLSPEDKSEKVLERFNWDKTIVEDIPTLISPTYNDDEKFIRYVNESGGAEQDPKKFFPIRVTNDSEHHKLFTLIPLAPEVALSNTAAEQGQKALKFEADDEELIKFIHDHDMFGTNVAPEHYEGVKLGENLMEYDSEKVKNSPVTLEEGAEAMHWVGRFITQTIAAKYPGREFAWFTANKHLRSLHAPAEIHIILKKA